MRNVPTNMIPLFGLLVLGFSSLQTPAQASNIALNGTFSLTSGTFGTAGGGLDTQNDYTGGGSLTDWTISDVNGSKGLAFLYIDGDQGSTTTSGEGVNVSGRFGNFSLYDAGNIAGSNPSGGVIPNTSPGGGNFIVADGSSSYNVAIYQSLSDLVAGSTYAVSFWYAAGQQYNRTGNTTEGWQVSLENAAQITEVAANGTTIQDTPTQADIAGTNTPGLISGGFQAWSYETFYFTAAQATQVLTFLSMGTPTGQPPAVLLSDVSLIVVTPEPISMAITGIGMTSLLGLVWFRRTRLREATVAAPHHTRRGSLNFYATEKVPGGTPGNRQAGPARHY
jgi:hypothetical protein